VTCEIFLSSHVARRGGAVIAAMRGLRPLRVVASSAAGHARGRVAASSSSSAAAAEAAEAKQPNDPRPAVLSFPKERGMLRNIDEALFLAKEAGIYTHEEVQLQIVRSPSFTLRDKMGQNGPFLLENFFDVADGADDEEPDEWVDEFTENPEEEGEVDADPTIHGAIQRYFRPGQPSKFWLNGEEWLARAEGRGTRKRATAHAVITRGTGLFKVNGESDVFSWWRLLYNRFEVVQPFKLTGTAGQYDCFVHVQGGGPSGQSGAARLAIARALFMANPNCHDALQSGFCLLEDNRQKMSKMPGKAGARAGYPWTKR